MSNNFTPDEMIELINEFLDRGPCGKCPLFDSEEPCQDVLLRAAGEMIRELKNGKGGPSHDLEKGVR